MFASFILRNFEKKLPLTETQVNALSIFQQQTTAAHLPVETVELVTKERAVTTALVPKDSQA